jgi:hypothetical protein
MKNQPAQTEYTPAELKAMLIERRPKRLGESVPKKQP